VTSVPAKSLEIAHRVGYVRSGYDADLVVWDSYPLSVGATAIQVYIDGKATLDPDKVTESLANVVSSVPHAGKRQHAMRKVEAKDAKETFCAVAENYGAKILITGIMESFLEDRDIVTTGDKFNMVIENGRIICFDNNDGCASIAFDAQAIHLENGYVLPGLTAVTSNLGLTEIWSEPSSSDGRLKQPTSLGVESVDYAKYGIHLDGRAFSRARIGGVTKAVTAPRGNGFAGGVSVGIKTSGKKTILDGGIFQNEVALHFTIGQGSKGKLPNPWSGSKHTLTIANS
jgi:imidazolonepropionase-like amidohydrolase